MQSAHREKINIKRITAFDRIHESSTAIEYQIDDLSPGYNFTEKHIIKLTDNNHVEWVTSRLCDHAGGTLQPCKKKNFAQCPLHGWQLDLNKLHYHNINIEKETLDFIISNNTLQLENHETRLSLPDELTSSQKTADLHIRFISHACLLITCGTLKLITDPWLKGPCFLNSWWHKPAPSDDALQQLLDADVIYISHNHPDHMHEETLLYLYHHRPDIPIIIPKFNSNSAKTPLTKIGFNNLHSLEFNQIYKIAQNNTYVSILKSGDFRDDSGLYLSYGKKQVLMTVDSSALNHYHLPGNIDVLATSFAAGASGYPWCFDHYDHNEKKLIAETRHESVKQSILKYLDACQPRAYIPYAGYFSEDASRDNYIKTHNTKNKPEDIEKLINSHCPSIKYINPLVHDEILVNDMITTQRSNIHRKPFIEPDVIKQYLSSQKNPDNTELIQQLIPYFKNCRFNDHLTLYLIPCDSHFESYENGLVVDFNDLNNINVLPSHTIISEYDSKSYEQRQLLIKARACALWQVINEHKSWEELSIGFHCRIKRKPDIYNSDFWYHFSNNYIR